jgi:large subunit ribosomal protein L10
MPKTRKQKEHTLEQLIQDLKSAKSATLASFSALTVSADQELRKNLRDQDITYSVIKKTLLRKAFDKLGYPADKIDNQVGNLSLAVSTQDEVAPAKTIHNFIQDHQSMTILGGILENKWIDQAKANELAQLLSKPELIAKTVGTIKAPLTSLVNVMAGNLRGLVNVLGAIKENKS